MAGVYRMVCCRALFKKLNMLPVTSEFLLLFFVDNMEKFQMNSDIHSMNTRHKHDLHMPYANLITYKKGSEC